MLDAVSFIHGGVFMRCCRSPIDLWSGFFVRSIASFAMLAMAIVVTPMTPVFSQMYYDDVDPSALPVT